MWSFVSVRRYCLYLTNQLLFFFIPLRVLTDNNDDDCVTLENDNIFSDSYCTMKISYLCNPSCTKNTSSSNLRFPTKNIKNSW